MINKTTSHTSAGRLVSRMNNFRHGGCANTLFLTSDNPEEFFSLLENAFEQHQPQFEQDADFVTDSVRSRWIFNRRQRACEQYENQLHERKPDGKYFKPDPDITEIMLFDRYVTNAERAMNRALKNLQLVQKMTSDKQRSQQQFEMQKQKFARDLERWEMARQREALLAAKLAREEAERQEDQAFSDFMMSTPTNPVPGAHLKSAGLVSAGVVSADPPNRPRFDQTLYIGLEHGVTVVYEVTPSNDHISSLIQTSDTVLRTYNFVGGVPDEYQHLITPDAATWGQSTSVSKLYCYDAWRQLLEKE